MQNTAMLRLASASAAMQRAAGCARACATGGKRITPVQKQQQQQQQQTSSIKDRYPPRLYDAANPKRRLAVLVDGSMVSAESYTALAGKLAAVGAPIVTRVFDTELKPAWQALVVANSVEWFRVEKFIPVHMQMSADAAHVVRYRHQNMVEGVCFVCAESETGFYEQVLERRALKAVNAYCVGSEGGRSERVVDGRSADGAPQ
jgi:hypothetical protein